jgi:hypothetical protein
MIHAGFLRFNIQGARIMSVSAIAGSPPAAAPRAVAPRSAEASESKVGGDHDGDSDDRAAVRPTVNASGQKLGQMVNVKA